MEYRKLKESEISALKSQGCYCADWASVLVSGPFQAANIHQVRFEGIVKLAAIDGMLATAGEAPTAAGLYACHIRDCDIRGPVYFSRLGRLQGYTVERDVRIENVDSLVVEGPTTFGNGVEIELLNEGGGREVPLFARLSAQIAYLLASYRHEPEMINKLKGLIRDYCRSKESQTGLIGQGAGIRDVHAARNVHFGPYSRVSGALLLEEGTIASCAEDPALVGEGVIARHFIILSGAHVGSGAILDKCLVGQGARIGKQLSAENSAFFANCEGFHSEAVSLFAGPYTVTHHRSSLLIAGMFSFFNAGSGTNQSNHMYKLGPLHQGWVERGCKTGSFSYMLWPCRVGAFSVVMDKHAANFDTADFPFSYITVEDGRSVLTPAMNLFTVGTKRDSEKWPRRDRRKDPDKLDLIHFDLFSPYITAKMIRGSEILQKLLEESPREQKYVLYKGASILRLMLKACRKYYQIALRKYFGEQLIKRLESHAPQSLADLRLALQPGETGAGEWADMAGMFAPVSAVREVVESLKQGRIGSVEALRARLKAIFDNYSEYAWAWYAHALERETGIAIAAATREQLLGLAEDWKTNTLKLNNMILKDAEKEFGQNSRIGFGADGDEATKETDFSMVRGGYENNEFVRTLLAENEATEQKAANWAAKLEQLFATP